ncbi:MAG: sulfurtransferase [Pseudomonadota bacterium]|jgi:thiosulfate/3-mercaptopyruvate sulfurtransferase|nr:sulfurtransferase [Pseudomonadota bacterium]
MRWTTLIEVEELAMRLDDCIVVDCRHDLADPDAGHRAWRAGRIPGARFLHQDHDLASPVGPRTGRHPLPDPAKLRRLLGDIGLDEGRQLVAYDNAGGATAARLWWLARSIGHEAVAVLDGGLGAWQAAGYPVESGEATAPRRAPADPGQREPLARWVDVDAIERNLSQPSLTLIDARTAERYRGEAEPIDPVAGHIPGALSRPLALNLRPDGRFLPAPILRQAFTDLLGDRPPEAVVHYCGSGVSACQNLLAMEHAGLHGSMLYPGSWSQWCSDPARPVATGEGT